MYPEHIPCQRCDELQQRLSSAQRPIDPSTLAGLNERGMINRVSQREERIRQAEFDLEKHRKVKRVLAATV